MQTVAAWFRSLNGAVRRCRKHTHRQLHHREMNRTVRLANTAHVDQNSIASVPSNKTCTAIHQSMSDKTIFIASPQMSQSRLSPLHSLRAQLRRCSNQPERVDVLHTQHSSHRSSHGSKQSRWYRCMHGSRRTRSPTSKSPRQIMHCATNMCNCRQNMSEKTNNEQDNIGSTRYFAKIHNVQAKTNPKLLNLRVVGVCGRAVARLKLEYGQCFNLVL